MKCRLLRGAALGLAATLVAGPGAWADDAGVAVRDARVRLAPDGSGAAYMTLEFVGEGGDRLVAADSELAADAELQGFWLEGCFAHRRDVAAIELRPGAATVLDPGGFHVRLTGLRPDAAAAGVPLRLTFERAGTVEIVVPVR